MGRIIPPLAAFLQSAYGTYMFQTCKGGEEQLISSVIFLFSIFLMLWKVKALPSCLKRLPWILSTLLQFLVCQFIMESLMNAFWFPLEKSIFYFMPHLGMYELAFSQRFGLPCIRVFRFCNTRACIVFVIYSISIMCLTAVLRAGAGYSVAKSVRRMFRRLRNFYKQRTCT